MTRTWLLAAASLLAVGCYDFQHDLETCFEQGGCASDDPPLLVQSVPEPGAGGVALSTALRLTFSHPMQPDAVLITLEPETALSTPTWEEGQTTVTVVPLAPLLPETAYLLSATGRDSRGKWLPRGQGLSFTTLTPDLIAPTLVSSFPTAGASDVDRHTPVELFFSEPMDPQSLSISVGPPAELGEPSWRSDRRTVSWVPSGDGLAPATGYTVAVTASDAAGNPMEPTSFSFTTLGVGPPAVIGSAPNDGADGVALNARVSLSFSRPMSAATTEAAFGLSNPSPVAVSCTLDPAGTVLTCDASSGLAAATEYLATLSTAATDLEGAPLAAEHSFRFTTGSTADDVAPTVSTTQPANLAIGVGTTSPISITFSEPMDQASTQASFAVIAPSGVSGAFQWSGDGRTLQFQPNSTLQHGATITWEVGAAATDLAGNPLAAAAQFQFRVIRLAQLDLYSLGAEDGDTTGSDTQATAFNSNLTNMRAGDSPENTVYRSLVSFNLSSLPSTATRVTLARLQLKRESVTLGVPQSKLGGFVARPVYYGTTLNLGAHTTPVLPVEVCTSSCVTLEEAAFYAIAGVRNVQALVTEFADDAFRHRADRQQRAQFRLQYRLPTNGNGLNDLTTYLSGNHLTVDERPHLLLSYEYP